MFDVAWYNQTIIAENGGGLDITEPSWEVFFCLCAISLAILLASAGGIGGGGILVRKHQYEPFVYT